MSKDFRPRISSQLHRRLRLYYFDKNINFSDVYESFVRLSFDESGEKKLWLRRVDELAEEEDTTREEILNNVMMTLVTDEGKFKPGAKQMYERSNSLGE